ncbi:hypothetical protein SOVF_119100 [Spinacia oleracea]|nr:hypothetical protein SOVF_119100 [Spinacia oleracea]
MANNALILAIVFLTLHIQLFPGAATTFTVENNCNYTVWPVIQTASMDNGFSLLSGESKVVNNISATQAPSGQLWGRTLCSTNRLTGNFSCLTGDCGSGKMDCQGMTSTSPTTLIDFSTSKQINQDFYDVSVVDGYNIPVAVSPQGSSCAVTGCVFDLNDNKCPEKLRVINNGNIIGCRNPCDVSHSINGFDCKENGSSIWSLILKKACPRAYTIPQDDATAAFSCPSPKSYSVTFCPSPTVASI